MRVDHEELQRMCGFSPKAEFTQVDTGQQSAAALRPQLSFHCITLHGSWVGQTSTVEYQSCGLPTLN